MNLSVSAMSIFNQRYGNGVLVFVLVFVLVCAAFPVLAWMPGYENAPAPYLVLVVEANLHMQGEALDEERNDHFWMEYSVALESAYCRIQINKSPQRPANFSQPDMALYIRDNVGVRIDHAEKSVVFRRPLEYEAGARMILMAGRQHRGQSLRDIYMASQDRLRLDERRGVRVLDIAAPYFDETVRIEFDEHGRPIRLVDGDEQFAIAWADSSPGEYPMVSRIEYRLDGEGFTIDRAETIREVRWIDNLPASVFTYETPSGYEVIDLRDT